MKNIKRKLKNIFAGLGILGTLAVSVPKADAIEPVVFGESDPASIEYKIAEEDLKSYMKKKPLSKGRGIPEYESNSHLSNVFELAQGIATGLGIHEGLHCSAAGFTGEKIDSKLTTYHADNYHSNRGRAITAVAGPMGNMLITEIAMKGDRKDLYNRGLAAYGILDNLRYAIAPNLRGEKKSDIGELERAGVDTDIFRAIIGAHALWKVYEYKKNPDKSPKEKSPWSAYIGPLPGNAIGVGLSRIF